MKEDKENDEGILSVLPLWGLLFLICVLLQVYVGKERPLIQPVRQRSIVKTDQKQLYLPELIQSLFDKEKTKGKEYQTFQVNLSDETIEKLKKMQGDRSQLAFINELVDEFLMLPYPIRDKLISQAKEMIKNPV